MISISRDSVPVPALLQSPRANVARTKAKSYFSRPKRERLQERFTFTPALWQVQSALGRLFHHKCAYCETPLANVETGAVDHFRPLAEAEGVVTARASASPRPALHADRDAYWWLAYNWDNLYLACSICARNKRNLFPVIGQRARPNTGRAGLAQERALLLDPCHDRPETHLVFRADGRVAPNKAAVRADVRRFHGHSRGLTTITIFGLNRPELVSARAAELKRLRLSWQQLVESRDFSVGAGDLLRGLVAAKRPYAAMCRQFVGTWLANLERSLPAKQRAALIEKIRATSPDLVALLAPEPSPAASPPPKRASKAKSGAAKRRRSTTPKSSGFIRSIYIQNFRAIRELDTELPFGREMSDSRVQRGWKVILGENGSGKSSILQATAFALMGQEYLRKHLKEFGLKAGDLLRKVRGKRAVKSGRVEITFSTGRKIVLKIFPDKFVFTKPPPSDLFVRGYGATRLMPRRNLPAPRIRQRVLRSVGNMFNPGRPLFNVNRWLVTLKRKQFGSAALSLRDLLNIPPGPDLHIQSRQVMVPLNGLKHTLNELSAGYESVLVMAADIMAGVMGTVHDFQHAPGIVLLDEIDAHLHPRWKMRIVDCLRRTFPSMQFIVSTHEPLCLRGVRENETLVVRRQDNEVICLDDLPSPSQLRVDQLLTSELFGLHTTIDPELDEKFSTYYDLLAKSRTSLTRDEQARLKSLRAELPPVRMVQLLGDNQRERLIYEVVDQYFASSLVHRNSAVADGFRIDMQSARESVKRKIAAIWKDSAPTAGSS